MSTNKSIFFFAIIIAIFFKTSGDGRLHEMDPICILDFYVHEDYQRCVEDDKSQNRIVLTAISLEVFSCFLRNNEQLFMHLARSGKELAKQYSILSSIMKTLYRRDVHTIGHRFCSLSF